MLKDDYDINIIGRQDYADFEEASGEITLNTTGSYTYRGGARFIAYKEYDTEDPKVSYTSVLKQSDHDAVRFCHAVDFGRGPAPSVPLRHRIRHLDGWSIYQRPSFLPGGAGRPDRYSIHSGHRFQLVQQQ